MLLHLQAFNLYEVSAQRFQVTSDHSASDRCSPAPPRVAIASDVNFQYLKHVVIKFMCSREDEALQLIRAVATLLEFSPQEEEHIRGYLNYKVSLYYTGDRTIHNCAIQMSWFGVLPPPLFPHK